MARCEECLHFEVCEALEQGNGLMKVNPIHCGCYKNTADVVPKSEVDLYRKQVEELEDELASTYDKLENEEGEVERLTYLLHCYALQYGTVTDQQKVIDKAKVEVATEIFEEIERLLREHSDYEILCDGKSLWYYEESLGEDIAELKKKYKGEE